MKRRYRFEPEGTESNLIYHDRGLFAMCDLLGFSEYVLQNDDFEVYNTIIENILGDMMTVKQFDIDGALESDGLRNKYGEEWFQNLSISYKIISDSFIIYPDIEETENDEQSFVLSLILGNMLRIIYERIMKLNKDILLRGIIMKGKYAYFREYNVIMGKGIVEAYRYEKMQNWSGILIHHTVQELSSNIRYPPNFGVQYDKIPFKQNTFSYRYENELAKKGLKPYVLNWVDNYVAQNGTIEDNFWYDKIDRILNLDGENKQSAIDKILNTKKFYDYVIEQNEIG